MTEQYEDRADPDWFNKWLCEKPSRWWMYQWGLLKARKSGRAFAEHCDKIYLDVSG